MKNYSNLSIKLTLYRKRKNESITKVAKAIGVDRTYLSKLENGHERPSEKVLHDLISHYFLSREEATELSLLAGYEGSAVVMEHFQGKEVTMENKQIPSEEHKKKLEIQMNGNTPIFYTDSVFVTSSQWGIVFDFAQNMGPTNQQTIVSRIGMSKEHAKALLDVIKLRLAEEEKKIKN